jgi:hypothetical protein
MRHRWPQDTVFTRKVLVPEERSCPHCGRFMHISYHDRHPLYTLDGPLELISKPVRCPELTCPGHAHFSRPLAQSTIALPGWLIAWDVFCWIGHRRCARHWSVPSIRAELADSYGIGLSPDAIEVYIDRYQTMLAARHQDPQVLAAVYQDVDELILSIDGIQPEKGHETLYVVRELSADRVWFAEALLSSAEPEVRRLLRRAREWTERLGKKVRLWLSDKQEAFVVGIAAEFPDVPHRYCANHFLRDVAKPVLDKDSTAKVKMRRKVRGLRAVERQVLDDRREAQEVVCQAVTSAEGVAADEALATRSPQAEAAAAVGAALEVCAAQTAASVGPASEAGTPAAEEGEQSADEAGEVVLDYAAAIRGVLNDDQGGPLHPPGLRMAEALSDLGESLQRNVQEKKGGARRNS